MIFDCIILSFPLVLAIHNFDEYSHYDDFVDAYHSRIARKFTSRRVVRYAAASLTLSAVVLAGLAYVYKGSFLLAIIKTSIFALMLNAIGHCLLSLRRRTLLPGTLSAAVLVMPYSIIAVAVMRRNLGGSYRSLLRFAAAGAVAIPLAVTLFLGIGYGISRLKAGNST